MLYKFVGADNVGSLENRLFPARAGKNMQTCTKFTCLARKFLTGYATIVYTENFTTQTVFLKGVFLRYQHFFTYSILSIEKAYILLRDNIETYVMFSEENNDDSDDGGSRKPGRGGGGGVGGGRVGKPKRAKAEAAVAAMTAQQNIDDNEFRMSESEEAAAAAEEQDQGE